MAEHLTNQRSCGRCQRDTINLSPYARAWSAWSAWSPPA